MRNAAAPRPESTRPRPAPPRHIGRIFAGAYIVRHSFGVGLLATLAYQAWALPEKWISLFLIVVTPTYAVLAFLNGRKILRRFSRPVSSSATRP